MTFLNPFVLLGLAAAAIPIILHLLNIRKLRTIEFSTLTFLKELQKSKMRRVKIRQLLLLVLRTLLVILIVVAFSRPALKGTLTGIGTHAKTTIVIIFDDTYSMSLHNERGTFLKQAQVTAFHLAEMLKEGDDALFIRLSDLPQATIGEPTHDIQKIRSAIRQSEAQYKHGTIEEALRLSSRLLLQSKNFNKEIYILTDNQKTTALERATQDAPLQQGSLSGVKLFIVSFSDKPFENVGIEKVEIPSALFQKGKPFSVRASVHNFGTTRVQNYLVNMFLDGARVMQKSVSVEGGGVAAVDFSATPQRTGFLSGYVELEEDAFDGDNKCFFSVTIPSQLSVLVASSHPGSSLNIRLALGLVNHEGTSTSLVLKEIAPEQLTSSSLAQTNVVILSNASSLSSTQSAQLAYFSAQGGGVILFPGDLMNPAAYSSTLLPRLGLPALRPIERRSSSGSAFLSFDKIDFGHPVFQGMFENARGVSQRNGNVESPKVFSAIRFVSEKEIRSIISLSDGTPFLWEKISSYGRFLGFAVAASTGWSDFPLKGIFVPLLYQTILYAASGGRTLAPPAPVVVGTRSDIPITRSKKNSLGKGSLSSQAVTILDPSGRETLVQASLSPAAGTSPTLAFNNASVPGIYTVVQAGDTLAQIPVNIDPVESNGEQAAFDDFEVMAKRYGGNAITSVHDPETIDTVVLQSRFGVELWKYFLLGALALALIEMIVARESKQAAT